VRNWFWVDQGAPQVVFAKLTGKPQFSTECLITYATQYAQERFGKAAAALYGLRKNKKLLEFCETYRILSSRDGRIHFSMNPAGTQTGRWTSSTKLRLKNEDGSRTTYSGNVQQVPSKTPSFDFGEGKEKLVDSLRDIFVADPGCCLLKTDFNALELRLIAFIHGARKLIEWIEAGADTHIQNAIGIFKELGLPTDARQVKPPRNEMDKLINDARDAAKPLAYAVSYQMSDPGGRNKYPTLYKTLKKIFPTITEEMANTYAARFFELHPEIKSGQQRIRQEIEKAGYTTNAVDGRRLYYPANTRGFNQALNFHMQSSGAVLINRALLALAPKLDWKLQAVRAQVHDELVLHCPLQDLDRVADLVEECMGQPAQLGETVAGVPAEADPGFDWGHTMSRAKFKELIAHGRV
jgi:DNA polymerase-1